VRRRYLALALLCAGAASPPPPPWAEARGDLDGDGKSESARLDRDGTLVVSGADGREIQRVKLPDAARISRASLRFVPAEDRVVVHARAEFGKGNADEVVIARDGVVFDGRTGPSDDGERSERLRVDEGGVVRWQTAPGFSRCDGNDLLFAERWDFAGRRFRAVVVDVPPGKMARTSASPPPETPARPLGLFRFVAASTDATGERRADMLGAPRELEDDAPATVWHAGEGGAATGAWATARAEAGAARVTALRVTSSAPPASVAVILGPAPDQTFRASLAPGTQWIVLPEAAATSCVSIVVARPRAGENILGEVAIYTDAEGARGLAQLITAVAELRPDVDGAARLLISRGQEAADEVAAALPTATGEGRRRLVQVLAAIRAPSTAPALGHALETAAAEDRATIVAALAQLGTRGLDEARRILGDASQSSEARGDAALVLGQLSADATLASSAIDSLVAAAGKGDAPLRRAIMTALSMASSTAAGASRVAAALRATAEPEAAGDLARALASGAARLPEDARAPAADAIQHAWIDAHAFALRLRLVRAMGALGDERLSPSLAAAARDADEVLRAEAVAMAAALPNGLAPARAAMGDADPGVRHAAAEALAAHAEPSSLPLFENSLAHDGWPLVRHAAAEGLGAGCAKKLWPAPPPLSRAVVGDGKSLEAADASDDVRRASLAALGRCADAPSSTFETALADRRQSPSLRELAGALVARRGGPRAAAVLAHALVDVLSDPAADERLASLAAHLVRALATTGDTTRPTLEALGNAANEPMSPDVRAAAMETIGKLCPTGAAAALRKGAADADGRVVRAANNALARCNR
jgi:HEAT repeat protein